MSEKIIIDKIAWWIVTNGSIRHPQPICTKHHLRLYPYTDKYNSSYSTTYLKCAECNKLIKLPRRFDEEKLYVIDKIDSKAFKTMKTINIDDEAIPLADGKAKNDKYFVTALLTESKVGQRLVVYAGEKGKKEKTQIFVEPGIKRLSFDHNDLNPSEVFLGFEATFKDGTKTKTEKVQIKEGK
jgi:hypothetical protein